MKRSKVLAALIILAFSQAVFAQESQSGAPENIITVDFGPTIIGITIGVLPTGDKADLSGFGISAQYERQLYERLSVAGRFAYLGSEIQYKFDSNVKAVIDLSSFSLEAHPRVYPFATGFFLDGMIGYADMSLDLTGKIKTDDGLTVNVPSSISRGYFKYGGKLGWRVDFGEPGGFIFEHSYGWYSASGMGDTMGEQIEKKVKAKIDPDFDKMFGLLEDYIFVGGPRMTFAFGWRF